jgi:hypothetical protein
VRQHNNKAKKIAGIFAFALALFSTSSHCLANPNIPISEDDTILVDQQPNTKIPYSKIVRTVIKKFFNLDSEQLMTFGGNSSKQVARSFSDYVDRTKTKVKVKEDEIEFELKLQF